jgi:hypothetical protein
VLVVVTAAADVVTEALLPYTIEAVVVAPAVVNALEVNTPVDGLNVIFVEVTLAGKLPVLAVTQTGNIVAFVAKSSVIAIFVAFVAVPEKAPTNDVEVSAPVEGLNDNFVDVTFCGRLPELAVTHVGYITALVVVSSVMAVLVALVAVPANPPVDVKIPVEGLNVNLVEVTLIGLLPELAVTHVTYIEAFVAVSSVVPTLVAFVALVAEVADVAVAALPVIAIDHVPEAPVPVRVGAYVLKLNPSNTSYHN